MPLRLLFFVGAPLLPGCNGPATGTSEEDTSLVNEANISKSIAEIPLVTLHTATTGRLPLRRQATGKLRARREVMIKSQTGGLLLTAPTEGSYYKKGDLLLATDPRPLELACDRALATREEAAFRQRDLLLRLSSNLDPKDPASITNLARENILIQSGLPAAEVAMAEAEYQLSLARFTAPFSGRATDVQVQPGLQLNAGEEVCTLIDPASLEAEFSLLEQELAGTQVQGKVFVKPAAFPELRLPATLDILNPRVDDGGLLRVRARLHSYGDTRLYPGMNVTIVLETMAPVAVVLPKSAIVLRSGRILVFTYDVPSGRAKWQYVTIGYENDEQLAITEGVEPGQQVIISGGLTLYHDSGVRVE